MLIVTLGEAFVLIITVIFVIAWSSAIIMDSIRKSACEHDGGVNETMACDAICRKCGKNLGFIGTEENKKRRAMNHTYGDVDYTPEEEEAWKTLENKSIQFHDKK